MNLLSLQVNLAGVRLRDAADAFDHLGAPRANQAGKAQNFAGMDREGGILEEAGAAQTLYLQHFPADLYLRLGEKVVDLAAHHGLDQVGVGDFIHVIGADILGIAEHRHAAGQPVHVLEAVGDEYDGDAFLAQLVHDAVKLLGFPLGQRRGRLVQNDDFGVGGQGLGDFDDLLLGHGQRAHLGGGTEIGVHAPEQLVGLLVHGPPLDDAVFDDFVAHEDVFGYRQVRIGGGVLVNRGDAGGLGVPRSLKVNLLPVEEHLALFGLVHPGDDLDKGGFAGAVFTHQGMHFSGLQLELNPVQRLDAGEDFCDSL